MKVLYSNRLLRKENIQYFFLFQKQAPEPLRFPKNSAPFELQSPTRWEWCQCHQD